MLDFPFGLDKEAEIYYLSSLNALRADPQVTPVTDNMAAEMKAMGLPDQDLSLVVDLIVQWTRQNIEGEHSNDDDENGVAWYMALIVKSYEKACAPRPVSYKDVYIR